MIEVDADNYCRRCNGTGRFTYLDYRQGHAVSVNDECSWCGGAGAKLTFQGTGKDGFEPARRALSDPKSSLEIIDAACSVLAESTHWQDIATVLEARCRLFAQAGAEIRTAEALGPNVGNVHDVPCGWFVDSAIGDFEAFVLALCGSLVGIATVAMFAKFFGVI